MGLAFLTDRNNITFPGKTETGCASSKTGSDNYIVVYHIIKMKTDQVLNI